MVDNNCKKEIVKILLKNEVLIDLETIESIDNKEIYLEDAIQLLKKNIDSSDYKKIQEDVYNILLKYKKLKLTSDIILLTKKNNKNTTKTINRFLSYYQEKFEKEREELLLNDKLSNLMGINRILQKKEKVVVSVIGILYEKRISKNGNLILTVEDLTGKINIIVNRDNYQAFNSANKLSLDEVAGFEGESGKGIIFCNSILVNKGKLDFDKNWNIKGQAAFVGNLYIGSKYFLENQFRKLIDWINGNVGNDKQKNEGMKIKYLFITGNLIEGLGRYVGYEDNLKLNEIKSQFEYCVQLFKKVRNDVCIIVSPGNTDGAAIEEPQSFYYEYENMLNKIPNLIVLKNSNMISIKGDINILLYYGSSFDYYKEELYNENNNKEDYENLVKKHLLESRNMSNSYNSSLKNLSTIDDGIMLDRIPDIFVSGIGNNCNVSKIDSVISISVGTFKEKRIVNEDGTFEKDIKCSVPILDLNTKEVRVINLSA